MATGVPGVVLHQGVDGVLLSITSDLFLGRWVLAEACTVQRVPAFLTRVSQAQFREPPNGEPIQAPLMMVANRPRADACRGDSQPEPRQIFVPVLGPPP